MNRTFKPQPLPGTRIATEGDFRHKDSLKLDVQYWEYVFASWTWELRWTEFETDRPALKTKLLQNFILVNEPPVIYNQRPLDEYLELTQNLTLKTQNLLSYAS